jgi:hypothetical protein
MQKSTRASALGSLAISELKGCVFFARNAALFCVHMSSLCAVSVLFQNKKKGISNFDFGPKCCIVTPLFHRKSGIELTGPDKSYFLWAPSKDAIEVRSISFYIL